MKHKKCNSCCCFLAPSPNLAGAEDEAGREKIPTSTHCRLCNEVLHLPQQALYTPPLRYTVSDTLHSLSLSFFLSPLFRLYPAPFHCVCVSGTTDWTLAFRWYLQIPIKKKKKKKPARRSYLCIIRLNRRTRNCLLVVGSTSSQLYTLHRETRQYRMGDTWGVTGHTHKHTEIKHNLKQPSA